MNFNKHSQLAGFLVAGVGVLVALFVIAKLTGIPFSMFSRDPVAILGGQPYIGMMSNLGVILWGFSTAICLYAYTLLRAAGGDRGEAKFLLLGGIISAAFLFDDMFMLHELLYPYETVLFAAYGVLMAYYLYTSRVVIIYKTTVIMLIIALSFNVMSVFVDRIPRTILLEHHLFEDGSKYLAIVSWLIYQARSSFQLVRPHLCLKRQ